jgi:hypothetical protein
MGLGVLMFAFLNAGELRAESAQVAVLDFKAENGTNGNGDWTVGLADFMELALQKENVQTLERRQIRLVLGERELQAGGSVSASDLIKRGLPAVNYFVSGSVRRLTGSEFELTGSLNRADNATMESSFTRRGVYPTEWLSAVDSLAREIAKRLSAISQPSPGTRSEFESLTWLPEAALPFFKGLEYYAHGDFPQAAGWFRTASGKDPRFDQARLWEARALRQFGFPELADFALAATGKRGTATRTNDVISLESGHRLSPSLSSITNGGEKSPDQRSRFEPRNHEEPPLPAFGHPLLHSEWRRGMGRGGAPVHGQGGLRPGEEALGLMGSKRESIVSENSLPVVAVIAPENIPAAGRAAFVNALARSGRFEMFEPQAIGATTREIDLQLTGQMAAPLNERSVWLVVDSMVFLEMADGELRARQNDLLSGRPVRQVAIRADGTEEQGFIHLAREFLEAPLHEESNPSPVIAENIVVEPEPGDRSEVVFGKVLRLVKAQPNQARGWIALADAYGDWAARNWALDKAIAAIDRERNQPDAPYLLASALWRKRHLNRYAVFYDRRAEYRENPVTNDLAQLIEWFPQSEDARRAMEESTHKAGIYVYSFPKDHRYLDGVFRTPMKPPKRRPTSGFAPEKLAPSTAPSVTVEQRAARLNQYLTAGKTALAWQVVNSIRTPDTASVQPRFRTVYDRLQNVVLRENETFQQFTNAVVRKQSQRALELGRSLLDCALRQQRMQVIEQCGALIGDSEGFPAQFEFVFTQALRYRNDFLLDAVTGLPAENISYRIEGNPPQLTRWTTYGTDYSFALVMGALAESARASRRPDLAARVFEALRDDETQPMQNRLTAACDLALIEHEQGRYYEALETLRDVLRQAEGTDLSVSRGDTWSGSVEAFAFDALRKVRLYTGADVDVCGCCGQPPDKSFPKPKNVDALNQRLNELWQQTVGGVGADNRTVKQQLLEQQAELLPAILYKLQNDQEASHMLSFIGQLGTNAASTLPMIVQAACGARRFEDYNNALYALGQMGTAAACAKPLLIVALEDSRSVFNAKYAMKKTGPAPPRVMPYLARLLHHKNNSVAERAANAIVESADLKGPGFDGKSGEELIVAVRDWWEESGDKQGWSHP